MWLDNRRCGYISHFARNVRSRTARFGLHSLRMSRFRVLRSSRGAVTYVTHTKMFLAGRNHPREMNVADNQSIGRRWESYRPSKGVWFWSCAGCVVATMIIGFNWGGWVTGGTASTMAADAASGARTQLAAASCVSRFQNGPDAQAQMAELKKSESYERGDLIKKNGWATMPGSKDPVTGAAALCAQQLVDTNPGAPKG